MVQVLFVLASTISDRLRGADRERGATAVEYGLIVALIAAVIIAAVSLLGDNIIGAFDDVNEEIGGARSTPTGG